MIHLLQSNTNGFDQVVFNQRNKAYGAYVLRQEYPVNILKSLLIGLAIIASLLAIPYLQNLFKKEKVTHDKAPVVTEVDLKKIQDDPKDKPDPPTNVTPPPPVASSIFLIPKITEEEVADTLTTMDDLKVTNPGYVNSEGGEGITGYPEGNGETDVLVDIEDKVYDPIFLDKQPRYPGGDEEMRKFLNANLQYPDQARQIGLEGTVRLTFLVDQFGHLKNIKSPRPVGGGLDEEAIRVMQLMPRWEPGLQGGHPVKVNFNFPIVFDLD